MTKFAITFEVDGVHKKVESSNTTDPQWMLQNMDQYAKELKRIATEMELMGKALGMVADALK
jgi:hypothetical protein